MLCYSSAYSSYLCGKAHMTDSLRRCVEEFHEKRDTFHNAECDMADVIHKWLQLEHAIEADVNFGFHFIVQLDITLPAGTPHEVQERLQKLMDKFVETYFPYAEDVELSVNTFK